MSDPTTGPVPERPADQPTEPLGPARPTHPTEPIGRAEPAQQPAEPVQPAADDPMVDEPHLWPADPADGTGPERQEPDWDTPAPAPYPVHEEPRGMPLGTLVFGLVVVALGLLILVSVFYDITLSGSAVAISLFLGAGLVLIIGGIIAARRSSGTTSTGA